VSRLAGLGGAGIIGFAALEPSCASCASLSSKRGRGRFPSSSRHRLLIIDESDATRTLPTKEPTKMIEPDQWDAVLSRIAGTVYRCTERISSNALLNLLVVGPDPVHPAEGAKRPTIPSAPRGRAETLSCPARPLRDCRQCRRSAKRPGRRLGDDDLPRAQSVLFYPLAGRVMKRIALVLIFSTFSVPVACAWDPSPQGGWINRRSTA
jgi:hypothetical protein